jgi:hypothetical protein
VASISAQGMHFQTLPTLHRSRNAFPTQLWTVPADKVQRSGKQTRTAFPSTTHTVQIKECISNTNSGQFQQIKCRDQENRSRNAFPNTTHTVQIKERIFNTILDSSCFLQIGPADQVQRSRNAFPNICPRYTDQGMHFQTLPTLHRSRQSKERISKCCCTDQDRLLV